MCDILSIANSRDVVKRLDEDEKGVDSIDTPGGKQEMTVISESGLYNVVLRSDKPEAKPFRKWVTAEVLPSIRKHGEIPLRVLTHRVVGVSIHASMSLSFVQ